MIRNFVFLCRKVGSIKGYFCRYIITVFTAGHSQATEKGLSYLRNDCILSDKWFADSKSSHLYANLYEQTKMAILSSS